MSQLLSAMRLTLLGVALPLLVLCQSDRGTITGTVADPGGAVIPGANLTVRNIQTGAVLESITTPTGNFTLAQLPVGDYELTVEAPGFKKTTQTGLRIQVAQTIRLDLILQVGQMTESVTVTAEAPQLKTENAEQSVNISGDRINALPLNFGGGGGAGGNIRSWTAFAMLSPGVVGNNQSTRINGSQGGQFKIIVEGQDVTSSNDTNWTSTVSQASVEMIQEFSLQTANYSAEFGQVAGGLFNFTTRSGTNQIHGSAYEYFANEALDARRPFTGIRQASRKHDAGFSVGGPVFIPKLYDGRNRTFFFFNYEMFRNRGQASNSFQTVPTQAYRDGDFSAALTGRVLAANDGIGRPVLENVIYDPLTSRVINGQVYRDPFPGNRIPVSRMDPVALAVQKLIPLPNNGNGLIQNWIPNNDTTRKQGLPGIKIDHSFSDKLRMSNYYSVQNTDQFTANDGLPVPITAVRVQSIYGHTARTNWDYTISPTLLLHFGGGLRRFHNPDSSPSSVLDYDAVSGIGFTGASVNPGGFPRITNLANGNFGGMALNMGPSNANRYWDGKFTGISSLTYIRGSHTYKIGGEFRLDTWTDRNTRGSQGILNFDEEQTGLPAAASLGSLSGTTGLRYASFLLGLADTASVNAQQDPQWRKKGFSLYVQDSWKVTRKLSLDYGLRWDLLSQGHEIHYRNSMFGPTIPNPAAGGLPGGIVYEGFGPGRCDCNFVDTYPYAIGPRLSFAYQLTPKTVIRSGIGVVYSNLPTLSYSTNAAILGVGFDQRAWDNPTPGGAAVVLRDGLQYNVGELYTPTLDPGLRPNPGTLTSPGTMTDRSGGRPGRVLQWNVSLQREILPSLVVEAAYVANRGVWLQQNNLNNFNSISEERLRSFGLDPNSAADRQLLVTRIDSPVVQARGFRAPYPGFPGSTPLGQALRPFPQFSSSLQPRWQPIGNSWYDSLQVKATKRYSHGLDFSVAYTWSKTLATNGTNNIFNRENQKGLSDADIPHIFVVGFNYEIPKFTQSKVVRAVVGGWTFGGILQYQSANLIAVPNSNNNLNQVYFQSTRMNRVPGEPLFLKDLNCGCINPQYDLVYNPKAWVDAAPGQWGTSAQYYSDYRQSRRPTEQFSLGRRFSMSGIREGMSLEIRGEFFNAFNRLVMAQPGGTNPFATPTYNSQGQVTGGFGRIDPTGAGTPRNGQLVARFSF